MCRFNFSYSLKKISTKVLIFLLYFILVINSALFIWINSAFYLFIGSFILGYSISSIRIYMNTAIMNTVSDKYVGCSFTIWTSISLLLQSLIAPFLGRWINEINDKFGFYIILILSLLIFVTLLLVNKTDKIKYAHKESDRHSSLTSDHLWMGLVLSAPTLHYFTFSNHFLWS